MLAERTRTAVRERIWRNGLQDHTIVIGFGTKGRAAVETLLARGTERSKIVVIDQNADAIEEASPPGWPASTARPAGPGARTAGIKDAAAVIVATDRDDAAVLVTLTARELDPDATIVAAAREAENVHLLKQSGADSVILSCAAAGRLLGQAVHSPQSVEVLEDLLSVGSGIDLVEREIGPAEAGMELATLASAEPIVAVVRGEHLHRFDDPRVATLETGRPADLPQPGEGAERP